MAMQERRRGKQRKHQDDEEKPTKEEYAIAKHLRFNVPSKEGRLVGMTVQYFIASKAVDCLLDSPWAAGKSKSDIMFTNRGSGVSFCDRLLQKGLFHRAARVERRKDREGKKKRGKDETEEKSRDESDRKAKKEKKVKKVKEDKEEEEKKDESEEGDDKEKEEKKEDKKEIKEKEIKEKEEKKDEEKKKRREKKLKLEMHASQVFKDGDEVFVWIYDPVPLKTFIIGLLLVLGAIGVCLFPLWPPEVRLGVYYLSLAAAGFVGVILSLCIVRLLLFCLVWGVSFGKHHFWFLPNLTEDVGFFESFSPLYKHDHCEDTPVKTDTIPETEQTSETTEVVNTDKTAEPPAEPPQNTTDKPEETGSESENDNGYEIVEHEDIEVEEQQPDEESGESQGDKKTN